MGNRAGASFHQGPKSDLYCAAKHFRSNGSQFWNPHPQAWEWLYSPENDILPKMILDRHKLQGHLLGVSVTV